MRSPLIRNDVSFDIDLDHRDREIQIEEIAVSKGEVMAALRFPKIS